MIDIKDIVVRFEDHLVLDGLSLHVPKGSAVVILGRSGVGKSVLLKSIVGLLRPEKGSIRVMGQEVIGMKPSQLNKLRKHFGYVFQYAALFDSMTVRENLEFPLRRHSNLSEDEITARVEELLKLVDLLDAIDKMPGELSGGMKKRIGLARAIIPQPDIVLYDEPTAGLDPVTAREISKLIHDLERRFGTTSITVTHDLECAHIIADRICILHDRRIVEEGTFDEMLKSEYPLTRAFFQPETV